MRYQEPLLIDDLVAEAVQRSVSESFFFFFSFFESKPAKASIFLWRQSQRQFKTYTLRPHTPSTCYLTNYSHFGKALCFTSKSKLMFGWYNKLVAKIVGVGDWGLGFGTWGKQQFFSKTTTREHLIFIYSTRQHLLINKPRSLRWSLSSF